MAALAFYDVFIPNLLNGDHDLLGTDHTLKALLSNAAPSASADTELGDLSEISAGNGYTAGGVDMQNSSTTTSGEVTVDGVSATITASGGSIGPFRYVILYNATATGFEPIGWWDKGSAVTLLDGDSLDITLTTDELLTVTKA